MNVSVIYVNYNTSEMLMNSIRSVKEQTKGVSYEIIVVDNNSEDNFLLTIEAEYPEVVCIQAKENLGFGRANNLGIEIAKGECIFFLNPDTLLINNAIAILYRYLQSSDSIGACGGNLYDENNQPTYSFYRRFPSISQTLMSVFKVSEVYFKAPTSKFFNYTSKPLKVSAIVGADLMAKRSVLDRTGTFDPAFFLYAEETELCYRIAKEGFKIMAVPDAKIMHLESKSPCLSEKRQYFMYQGFFRLFHKIYGGFGLYFSYCFTQLKNYRKIFIYKLLSDRDKLKYWTSLKQIAKEALLSLHNN